MAWNRPTDGNGKTAIGKKTKAAGKPLSSVFAIIAIVIIAAIGAACYFLFFASTGTSAVEEKVSEEIVEPVKEIVFDAVRAGETNIVDRIDPNARPSKVGEIVNGYIKLPSGRIHRIRGERTNDTSVATRQASYHIFKWSCDNEIACYLSLEPGRTLVGTPYYNGRFKKEFLESLKEPLIPPSGSSEEDRALYKAVADAKVELKAAHDRGEDIEQIMLETRKQLQEMGRYKMALEQNIRQLVRDEAGSIEDVDFLLQSANRKLEEKGIAPIDFNPLARKRFERYVHMKVNEEKALNEED